MKLTIEADGCVLYLDVSAGSLTVNPGPPKTPVQASEEPVETPVQASEKPAEAPVQASEEPVETPVQASEKAQEGLIKEAVEATKAAKAQEEASKEAVKAQEEAIKEAVQEPAVDAGKMLGELVKAAANAAKTGKKRLAQKLIKDFGGETLGDVPGDKQVELLRALKDLT